MNNTKFSRRYLSGLCICGLCILVLSACATESYRAPVVDVGQKAVSSQRTTVILDKGRQHRVNEGESLYVIAWMYDLDYNALAVANNISSPYVIFLGQELSLDILSVPATSLPPTSNNHDPESSVIIRSASGNSQSTSTYSDKNLLNWFWPAEGNIISKFSVFNNKNKGIDIAGNNGDSVFAAESGEVVYAGNGLLRYGELVIVKHNDQFLSAYAHNDSLDVSEGDIVRRGQKIADLGSTGIDRNMLHFEIRLAGQPVDPEKYLPLK